MRIYGQFYRKDAVRLIVEILVVRNVGVSAFLRKLRHFLRQSLRQISVRHLFDNIVCFILTRVSSVRLIVLYNHGPEKENILHLLSQTT